MNSSYIWKNCLDGVNKHISPQHFATWFRPIKVVDGSGSTIELEVPNRFFLEWIKEHYEGLIEDVLDKISKDRYTLKWKVVDEGAVAGAIEKAPPMESPKKKTGAKTTRKNKANNLHPRYTFDNFVIGKANEFAHAACFATTKQLGSKYNPLFIYGGVGLGKTHLLQAIGNKLAAADNDVSVCYYTSERFMNEFINYVSRQKMADFRKKFRNVDVLLIDDIQFWSGKEGTQEEFFHTFNALYEAHKQVVVTSDKFPKDLDGIEERLRSRFEWGLVADIQPPDIETKVAIVKNKAKEEGIELPGDVAMWLSSISGANIRELEGYLNRVLAVSSLTGQDINLEMSKDALKNITREREERRISIQEIQKAVAKYFNIKVTDLKSKKRHKMIAVPRHIAMYIAREKGEYSYPEIGSAFGGKDHSTAIHAVKKIDKAIGVDTEIKNNIKKILQEINK